MAFQTSTFCQLYNLPSSQLKSICGEQYSYDENIGYFYDGEKILSIRKNGEVINSWTDFSDFLNSEITIAEQMMIKKRGSN